MSIRESEKTALPQFKVALLIFILGKYWESAQPVKSGK